ncbi:oligopeptide transport system permease protein OppC [Lachnospiraceae bacterium]|nr:oligopeptide transport system permease protein OppC [Lachnospiraceae bacterium]
MDKKAMKKLFFSNKMTVVCTILLMVIILASLLAPLSPYDPDAVNVAEKLEEVSKTHILGTDELGRDTFTRALYGGRVSLMVGFAAMCVAVVIGTLIGTFSGFKGGKVDMVCMRVVDVFLSVPSLLFIIVVYSFMPRNMVTLVFMLASFSWTRVARVVRAQTLTLKERDFVLAANALGVRQKTIIWRHIIPNLMPQIIVAASLSIANAILDESALSFLGYGVQLPMASWGSMLQSAQQYILHNPILAVVPGTMILVTVLCFNVLGDMLQQILDPKLVK